MSQPRRPRSIVPEVMIIRRPPPPPRPPPVDLGRLTKDDLSPAQVESKLTSLLERTLMEGGVPNHDQLVEAAFTDAVDRLLKELSSSRLIPDRTKPVVQPVVPNAWMDTAQAAKEHLSRLAEAWTLPPWLCPTPVEPGMPSPMVPVAKVRAILRHRQAKSSDRVREVLALCDSVDPRPGHRKR